VSSTWIPPTDRGIFAWFGYFKKHRAWALLIALICLVGIAYGFYYYRYQFSVTPWYLWIFVPDSPLAVLWAELALIAFWLRRPSATLESLAIIGNVQVGLWTVYVLLAYADSFGTYQFSLNTILLAGHAGMAVLALVFVDDLRARGRRWVLPVAIAAGYYIVNDIVDYFGPDFVGKGCGMRPFTVPCDAAAEPTLTLVTFGLTVIPTAALLVAINVGRE
jgi:uncharacterized membrane protein YpjA